MADAKTRRAVAEAFGRRKSERLEKGDLDDLFCFPMRVVENLCLMLPFLAKNHADILSANNLLSKFDETARFLTVLSNSFNSMIAAPLVEKVENGELTINSDSFIKEADKLLNSLELDGRMADWIDKATSETMTLAWTMLETLEPLGGTIKDSVMSMICNMVGTCLTNIFVTSIYERRLGPDDETPDEGENKISFDF